MKKYFPEVFKRENVSFFSIKRIINNCILFFSRGGFKCLLCATHYVKNKMFLNKMSNKFQLSIP